MIPHARAAGYLIEIAELATGVALIAAALVWLAFHDLKADAHGGKPGSKGAWFVHVGARDFRSPFGKVTPGAIDPRSCPRLRGADAMASYAVVWRDEGGPLYAGKLELGPDALRVQGSSPEGLVASRTIAYAELVGVRIGRGPTDGINGRPSVVLDRGVGRPISIAAVSGAGIVHEVAHLLAELAAEKREQASRPFAA